MAVIIPEVFGDAVNARLGVKLRAAQLATDYTNLLDITEYGDTIHFPQIDRITAATEVTKGTPLVPSDVKMTDSEAKIKQVGTAVRLYDKDSIQVKGALKDNLAIQVADALAVAVDADLVKSIKTDAAYKEDLESFEELTQAKIDSAFDVFGDDVDNDSFSGILINSKLRSTFMNFPAFTDANKTFNGLNGNGIVRNGVIGYWNGTIPVIVGDNETYETDGKKALVAIVKKDALSVIWRRQPSIEEARAALHLATDIVAQELYATKLTRTDGVSVLTVKLGE